MLKIFFKHKTDHKQFRFLFSKNIQKSLEKLAEVKLLKEELLANTSQFSLEP